MAKVIIDYFSGRAADLKPRERTADNVLRALASDPRVSTFDMSEYRWLRNRISDLVSAGLIVWVAEPYPWCRYTLTDDGKQRVAHMEPI